MDLAKGRHEIVAAKERSLPRAAENTILFVALAGLFIGGAAAFVCAVAWSRMPARIFVGAIHAAATIPAALVVAILPVLSSLLARGFIGFARRPGDLWATCAIAAAAGCAGAGYYLIPAFGIRKTLYMTAALDLAIVFSIIVIIIDRLRQKKPEEHFPAAPEPEPTRRSLLSSGWILPFSSGLTGFAALIYIHGWSRALTLVIGSSVYSFTAAAIVFFTGLALGGFLYARVFGERKVGVGVLAAVEMGIGLAALGAIPFFEQLPLVFLSLLPAAGDSFSLFVLVQVLMSAPPLLLPSVFLGMSFPLVARLPTQRVERAGGSVGAVAAANSLGAALGFFAGGFVVIPRVGIENSIIVAAAVNLLLGAALVPAASRLAWQLRCLTVAGVLSLLAVLLMMPRWDRLVLTSGAAFHEDLYKKLPTDSLRLETMRRDELLYYRDGLHATVSVHRNAGGEIYLKTNGRIAASKSDALTQLMIGYIPLLLHPDAKQAAIMGLGTGAAAKAMSRFPLAQIDTIESEPAMVEAAGFFDGRAGDILADRRLRLVFTDARNYISAAPSRYDVIAANLSFANLYTREFYETVSSHLKEDGIFAQWFQIDAMSPADLRMVLGTFGAAFPHVSVWGLQAGDLLLVGSKKEQRFDYPRLQKLSLENEELRGDLKALGLSDVYAVMGFYRMGKKELMSFTRGGGVNTDDGLQLEFSAARSFDRHTPESSLKLMEPFWTEAPWLRENRLPPSLRHYHLAESYMAPSRVAHSLLHRAADRIEEAVRLEPSNPVFHLLRARILLAEGQTDRARQSALLVLERSPGYAKSVVDMAWSFDAASAKMIFARAVKSGTREIEVFIGLGNIALYHGDLNEAQSRLDEAGRIDPAHPQLLRALGQLMFRKGEIKKAKDILELAKEKGENSATLYNALGVVYTELALWERAVDAYKEALRFPGPGIEQRRYLAVALANAERLEEAKEKFREILALSPGDEEARRELAKLRTAAFR